MNKTRPFKLGLIASFVMLVISAGILLAWYKLTVSWAEDFYSKNADKTRELIVNNLTELIRQPLAIESASDIKRAAMLQMKHAEVFGIEVYSKDGDLLEKQDKFGSNESVHLNIEKKEVNIVDDRDPISVDSFDAAQKESIVLGRVVIYLIKEDVNQMMIAEIKSHAVKFVSIFIILFGMLVWFFTKISKSVKILQRAMKQVEDGEKPNLKGMCMIQEMMDMADSINNLHKTVKEQKEELFSNLCEVDKSRAEAEMLSSYKESFIKSISHDLKTPVGVIKGLMGLISDEMSSNRQISENIKNHVSYCIASANSLNKIIDDLFVYERLGEEDQHLNLDDVVISDVINDMKNLHYFRFKEAGKHLKFITNNKIHDEAINTVKIDSGKLVRILENLLDNAFKYTGEGSVMVTWAVSKTKLFFSVQDSGIGISNEDVQHIFEKHFCVNPVSQKSGRGLGLYYVKKFTEVMGGVIKVESTVGFGSRFTIELPIEVIKENRIELAPIEAFENISDEDILLATVIDDREDNCVLLEGMLKQVGVRCQSYQIPGLGYAALQKKMPDIIFMDYHMDGLNGKDLACMVRKNLNPGVVPIVCVTADASETSKNILAEYFDVVLTKPIEKEALWKVIYSLKKARSVSVSG
jgi:signal transduction histidine kinase